MSPPHTPEMLDSPEESCLQMPGWSCCLAQSVPWLLASFESDPTQLTPTSWVRKGVPSTSDSHSALHFGTTVFMVLPTPMCPSKDPFSVKLKAGCPPPAWWLSTLLAGSLHSALFSWRWGFSIHGCFSVSLFLML